MLQVVPLGSGVGVPMGRGGGLGSFLYGAMFFLLYVCFHVACMMIIVRHVKKSEEQYYDIMLKYSEAHLMLYPYHLADIVVRGLRMTPFNYYINIIMVCVSMLH